MYCIFPCCIRFAILISLSNANDLVEGEMSLSIEKRKGSHLGAGDLTQKVTILICVVHRLVSAKNNTGCASGGCRGQCWKEVEG